MRNVIIGDIHGCFEEFQKLIEVVNLQPGDKVICLGDFMDKGPYPVECLQYARRKGFASIKGNHEERHAKWRRNVEREKVNSAYKNAMRAFSRAEEQVENSRLTEEDLAWIRSLPYYIEVIPGLLAVHGGLLPGLPLKDQPEDKIIRARWVDADGKPVPTDYDAKEAQPPGTFHWTEQYDGDLNVVYGHEAHSLHTPRIDERPNGTKCYGIDTGCVHGGRLTAMVVANGHVQGFVQVPALKKYANMPWG